MTEAASLPVVAHYIGVWRLFGANSLADGAASFELGMLGEPGADVRIVADPEPYFSHIDRSRALLGLVMKGLFGDEHKRSARERFETELERVRIERLKEINGGAYLVIEGHLPGEPINPKLRGEAGDFTVTFDGVNKEAVRTAFRPVTTSMLTAAAANLKDNADRQYALVGDAIYLTEGASGKPIYSFTMTGMGARLSVSSPLDAEVAARIAQQGAKLLAGAGLERSARLLTLSHDRKTDSLQAFLAGWSALEIFVNKCFAATYEARWFELLEGAAPPAAAPVFERLRHVMHDKYRLADKFLVIAATLSPDTADADGREFVRVKKVRDALLHGEEVEAPYPIEAIQALLQTYMRLHLEA